MEKRQKFTAEFEREAVRLLPQAGGLGHGRARRSGAGMRSAGDGPDATKANTRLHSTLGYPSPARSDMTAIVPD